MKKTISSVISFAATGIAIGIPITLACMLLIGGFHPAIMEFLVWTVASALFGVLSGLLSKWGDKLSLPAHMALHCLGCLTIAISACLINGYASDPLDLIISILPVFVIIYAIVYTCCYLAMKKEAKQVNEALQDK